jgi:hypothetical protein
MVRRAAAIIVLSSRELAFRTAALHGTAVVTCWQSAELLTRANAAMEHAHALCLRADALRRETRQLALMQTAANPIASR